MSSQANPFPSESPCATTVLLARRRPPARETRIQRRPVGRRDSSSYASRSTAPPLPSTWAFPPPVGSHQRVCQKQA
ncbi:hypothetical protein ZWY2020_027824 [Hordeum vulgare]|nr:hypothetical protein ZWY2020_027824 [Hordeum vulgare]